MERHAITSLFILDAGDRAAGRRHPPARPPARRRRLTWARGATSAGAAGADSGARRAGRATRCSRAAIAARGAVLGALPRRRRRCAIGRALGWRVLRWLVPSTRGSRSSTSRSRFRSSTPAAPRARGRATTFVHAGAVVRRAGALAEARAPADYVTIEGRAVLDAALAGGRGAIAVTGHVGNWELLAAPIARAAIRSRSSRGA